MSDRPYAKSLCSPCRMSVPQAARKVEALPRPSVNVGGAAPDLTGITAVFDEPNGKCRRDTYTHFPSRFHESIGTEEREMPNPKPQLSHTVIMQLTSWPRGFLLSKV